MATLKEYFDTDLQKVFTVGNVLTILNSGEKIEILCRVHQDFDANVKYVSFYIPKNRTDLSTTVKILIDNLEKALSIGNDIHVKTGLPGERMVNNNDLIFSGKIFIYSEENIDDSSLDSIKMEANQKGILVQFRGPLFALERSKIEKPIAFISHDSKDKDLFARPIAIGLSKLMCLVWFDEYSLKVGDNLRESVEQGIKECKKCILVLSPNFLANKGWTKTEFDSIFTREVLEKSNLVLPVWCGINSKEIFNFSPSLANKVGVKFEGDMEQVIKKLYQSLISS